MKGALAALASLSVFVGCAGEAIENQLSRPPSTVAFEGTDALLYVEVADQLGEQRQGLMDVEHLPADQGIAFVYDEPVDSTFWMKDTIIPLSIAFFDESSRLIGIRDMQPCDTDSCPNYGINEPYILAIEANLGWFEEHGIEPGDRARLRVSAYG